MKRLKKTHNMLYLGIETSCDDTGVALYNHQNGSLKHLLYSQLQHSDFGGIIPELASRDHIRKIMPLLQTLLAKHSYQLADLDGICFTNGPGLLGSLLVGVTFAKALAWSLSVPAMPVNHLEAHLIITMQANPDLKFPFLGILVSGGHTLLVAAKDLGDYQVIGHTLDDAAGECFDKTAKLLGLGYPGGAKIANLALQGNSSRFTLPRPMLHSANYDFSFSGLKTKVRQTWLATKQQHQDKCDIALATEEAIVDIILKKTMKAANEHQLSQIVLAGGVAANTKLRARFKDACAKAGKEFFVPTNSLCTDNGAMIAYTGARYFAHASKYQDLTIEPKSKWPLDAI